MDPSKQFDPYILQCFAFQPLDGEYELVRPLGSGGYGFVVEAKHLRFEREVAIKLIKPDAMDASSFQRFVREARLLSQIQHPNIVKVFLFDRLPDGGAFIVMELLKGTSLAELLSRKHFFELPQFTQLFLQAAKALSVVHERGIIHRDIKPDNLLVLDQDGTLKLVDFGLAKNLIPKGSDAEQIQRLTELGNAVGTPHYMSPEQCCGEDADMRSDIYSLGCVMYESWAGVPPFQSDSPYELMMMQVTDVALPPSHHRADHAISDRLDSLIMKMLEKQPAARVQNAAALIEELELYQEQPPPIALKKPSLQGHRTSAVPPVVEERAGSRRHRRLVIMLGFVVCIGASYAIGSRLIGSVFHPKISSTELSRELRNLAGRDNLSGEEQKKVLKLSNEALAAYQSDHLLTDVQLRNIYQTQVARYSGREAYEAGDHLMQLFLDKKVPVNPGNVRVQLEAADPYGNLVETATRLEPLIDLHRLRDSEHYLMIYGFAHAYTIAGQFERARTLLTKYNCSPETITRFPRDDAYIVEGVLALRNNDAARAFENWEALLLNTSERERREEAAHCLFRSCVLTGDRTAGREYFKAFSKFRKHPNERLTAHKTVLERAFFGDWTAAENAFRDARAERVPRHYLKRMVDWDLLQSAHLAREAGRNEFADQLDGLVAQQKAEFRKFFPN